MPVITSYDAATTVDSSVDLFLMVDVSDTSLAATGTDKNLTRDTFLAGDADSRWFSGPESATEWRATLVGTDPTKLEIVESVIDGVTARSSIVSSSATDDTIAADIATFNFGTEADLDGSRTIASVGMFESVNNSEISMSAHSVYGAELDLVAGVGQTTTLFACWTPGSGALMFEITGDNRVGFYGHTAVAQQTGVAVSDAAIHAALVNLGLITT